MSIEIPCWEKLKVIGRLKAVGLTALIPFIGYLLIFNHEVISFLSIPKDIVGIDTDPTASISRLYFLYFGLSFVGFSSILYSLFCPSEIKQNLSNYDYANNEINIMTYTRLHSISEEFSDILVKDSSEYEELSAYVTSYNTSDHETTDEEKIEIENAAKLDILNFKWRYLTASRKVIRLLILLGYLTGFILVLIPSIKVFFQVLTNLIMTFGNQI